MHVQGQGQGGQSSQPAISQYSSNNQREPEMIQTQIPTPKNKMQAKPQTPVHQRPVQTAPQERERERPVEYERKQQPQPQHYHQSHQNQTPPHYRTTNDVSNYTPSEATRADEYSHYDNEAGTFRVSQDRHYFTPTPSKSTQNIQQQHWSSPERSIALGRKNMHAQSTAQRVNKLPSPGRNERTNNSMALNTMSRWSTSNGRPDPSVLDVFI